MSIWGTTHAPSLPHWLTDNPLPYGRPWGQRSARWTNYYHDTPETGKTRYYDWTISKEPCSPDGVNNTCLLVNNQFPGPLIEANWGDWVEVKVYNNISDEGTAIHWHGLLQKETPYMDGTPGLVQCPIAPYSSFTYRFKADLYGSSWYHSHWSSQYGSGLLGPMVIYGPKNVDYDVDLGPIMISDYYHAYYQDVVDALLAPLPAVNIPMSDNNLINGKNSFDCSTTTLPCTPGAPMATFNFTSGLTYRLRLINPSSAAVQKFSIDGHTMTVIANDFVEVEPYETDVVTLAVGQRSDVLVKAIGSPGSSYWMRGYKPPPCWPTRGGNEVKAAVFYEQADRSQEPTSAPVAGAYSNYCGNDALSQTVPFMSLDPGEPTVTEVIPLTFQSNGTNLLWYMANRTFRADYNDPVLLEAKLGNLDFPYERNVHNYGTNRSVRFIIENAGVQPHPMHLHGHNMFILAEGTCAAGPSEGGIQAGPPPSSISKRQASPSDVRGNCWDGTITNPTNPQRRDVQMLLPGQYIVVQWNQDNPGVWPMHCHIAWHLSAGFVWTVLEQPGAVQQNMQIPGALAQTCRDWAAWTGDHVVDQIDDGL
nr:oxidoreductase ops5 [Quercus suber]